MIRHLHIYILVYSGFCCKVKRMGHFNMSGWHSLQGQLSGGGVTGLWGGKENDFHRLGAVSFLRQYVGMERAGQSRQFCLGQKWGEGQDH